MLLVTNFIHPQAVLKNATGDSLFHFCKKKKKKKKMDIFSYQRKKKWKKEKNCGRPSGHNFGHPLDRNQTFFYGQPHYMQTFFNILDNIHLTEFGVNGPQPPSVIVQVGHRLAGLL